MNKSCLTCECETWRDIPRASHLFNHIQRRQGILHRVVQQARDDRRRVQLHICYDTRYPHWVREIGLPTYNNNTVEKGGFNKK